MIGITSYGGYIPRLRLNRKTIAQNVAWLAPAVAGIAQGEKAVCNWDEDAVTMAVAAARDCLIGQDKRKLDGLYLASTSLPFVDRQNAGIVGTALNLSELVDTVDFTSSLRAATSALLAGLRAVKSGEQRTVLVAAADRREAKAASSQEMVYGDGAAAVLVGADDVIAAFQGYHSVSYDFVDHYRGADRRFDYTWEERWIRDEGFGKIIPDAVRGLLTKLGLTIDQVDKLAYPCFAKGQHLVIGRTLGIARERLIDNLHEVCGDTGTAHPLVMLVAALEQAKPGERIVVAGFGQGCDALCFEVTENISKLDRRRGINGSLASRRPLDNYIKYLKFRGLIETEEGIRAEVPAQHALTALWRQRKMILGLVGGKCRSCGTAQFPAEGMCVNEECGAVDSQDCYEFADVPAAVKSFTADTLAFSVDPPSIYGIVEFSGGGRFLADFTDFDLSDVRVGLPVDMSFRVHARDRDRGFTGYFWKAAPQSANVRHEEK